MFMADCVWGVWECRVASSVYRVFLGGGDKNVLKLLIDSGDDCTIVN